ncbi:MAG: DUF11 domain-containing protein, partial [Candidatus Peribacteraceae bacterium]|nr:DUF11 domain-containing protein [Candidatus Peribacteraceae bacterium]
MELKKHVSSFALAALLFTQLTTGTLPMFQPLIQKTTAAASGDFQIEGANEKYSKTWITTITCRSPNGATQTYLGLDNRNPPQLVEMGIPNLVAKAIRDKNLPYTQPNRPLVSSRWKGTPGGGGGGNVWNIGTPEDATLNAVCKILGSPQDSYVSFDCHDGERGAYPAGKCNYHSPGDNQLMSFVGTFSVPKCQDGIDNDGDGATDLQDFSCGNDPNRDDETSPQSKCQNGVDDDGDNLIDFPQDPGCTSLQDNDEGPKNLPVFSGNKTADVQSVRPGGFVTYSITFTNTSNVPAHNIRIVDTIPSNTVFEPNGSSQGCGVQGSQVHCQNQSLAPGQTIQAFLRFRVNANASCGSSNKISNTAQLQQNGQNISGTQTNAAQTPIDCAPQCSDGIDNDNDGATDLQDFSCQNNPNDTDETNPKAQCQDGLDNDGDGKTDIADPRCHTDNNASNPNSFNPQDNDEFPADVTQCNDGIDNDNDGATDLQDFSCQNNPNDTDETNPKAQCQDGLDNDGDGKTDIADPRCHTDNNASNPNSFNPQDNDEFPADVTQ